MNYEEGNIVELEHYMGEGKFVGVLIEKSNQPHGGNNPIWKVLVLEHYKLCIGLVITQYNKKIKSENSPISWVSQDMHPEIRFFSENFIMNVIA